ncbi:GNAT family N-acetyltransferase [Nocardioides sp.]|uniref:GNAT family N-acetyltransferase n=1 Tax=Nocardioides sp. TaxID=35761 RepID=UPI003783872F
MRSYPTSHIEIHQVRSDSRQARAAVRSYLVDVAGRYYGRPATESEVADALALHPLEGLEPPAGMFLVAMDRLSGELVGCVGLAVVEPAVGEVQRLHVVASHRRRGLGRALLLAVESLGREWRLEELRLDTRHDLVESQALYRSMGFSESEPHSAGPYAEVWFRKRLT